jgi:hypothetical protein
MGIAWIDANFIGVNASCRWVISFTPRPLYPRYPLDRRLGGPQSRFGWRSERKILDSTGTWIPTLHRPVRSQSLYRLSYPGSIVVVVRHVLSYLIVVIIIFVVVVNRICIVFILCSVSFIVCVVLCAMFCLSAVLFCVMCVICVFCLIVVSLPPGKNPFAV